VKDRPLTLFDATMLVMGGIIGVGIFFNPTEIAGAVSSEGAYLAMWGLGALAALSGAMTFAELSAAFPRVGGWYVWLSEAFGRRIAFLFAWTVLFVVSTGACAVVARFFAEQVLALLAPGAGNAAEVAVSALAILGVTGLGLLGLKSGALFQNACMALKLGAIATFVLAGFAAARGAGAGAAEAAAETAAAAPGGGDGLLAASLAVLFSYGGWQLLSYVAPRVEDPRRNLPRAIVLGVGGVAVVYLLVNLAYLRVLGLEGIALRGEGVTPMAVRMAEAILGESVGATFVTAAMAVSALGFLVATLITTPGIYVAMAREGLFLPAFGRLHPRTGAPTLAFLTQCGFALAYLGWTLVDFGFVDTLTRAVVFAEWIFHGLAGAALLVLARRTTTERPFRSPLYPLFPALYAALAAAVVIGNLAINLGSESPEVTLIGVVAVGLGALAYPILMRRDGAPRT